MADQESESAPQEAQPESAPPAAPEGEAEAPAAPSQAEVDQNQNNEGATEEQEAAPAAEGEANTVAPEAEAAPAVEEAAAAEEPAVDAAPAEEAPAEEAAANPAPAEEVTADAAPAEVEEPATEVTDEAAVNDNQNNNAETGEDGQAEGEKAEAGEAAEAAGETETAEAPAAEETADAEAKAEVTDEAAEGKPAEDPKPEEAAESADVPADQNQSNDAAPAETEADKPAQEEEVAVEPAAEALDRNESRGPTPKADKIIRGNVKRMKPVLGPPPVVESVQVAAKAAAASSQPNDLEAMKPKVNLEATATVKFVLMPAGQVVTLACTLGQTLDSLKAHFASELKMSPGLIMLMFDGKTMPDSTQLADLGVGPNGTVQLEMQSADPVNTPLKSYRPRQEYHMPDVITVRVVTDCESKDVVVEIERSRNKKPFLGGFRNKNTGVEFHNASARTMQKPRPPPTSERYCRDTQTCEQKNTRQQTTNTTSTQMTGIGVYVSNLEDKLITPGKYFSADDYWSMVIRSVIILQKYYRRWLARRYVTKLKEDKAKRLEWERAEEIGKQKEKEDRIKKDYARRINPKTKADFDMLVHCLEKWRQEEMERINSTLEGAERKAALCMLLDQETELLSAIERHKNEANQDNKEKKIASFLEKAAAPKKWQGHDGKLTYMDTPYTIRAKELRDIYNSINMKYLTQDERLDVLLTLKHTVKEHDCKLTQEIIELIDREADLLMRGVKEANLTGLRKRISTLFLQYIKTPTFNPEAAKLLKVPQDPSLLKKNINYCHSCGNYKPSTEFYLTSNSRNVGRCRSCQKVENDGRQREDHHYYKVMLRALRKDEEATQDGSSICFLIQEHDLRYLIEKIWSNQSILSAWDDLYDLVMVRWDKHQEWSPWNTILLTHDEAEAHKKLFSLEEGYGHVFIHKVTQKHNFARNYFSRLPGMAELLRDKLGQREREGPAVAGLAVQQAPQAAKAAQRV